jgi:hypothetical protein
MKNLRHTELAITWVVLREPAAMSYISYADVERYRAERIDYEMVAMGNLRQQSRDQLFTHASRSESGALIYLAAMHADGLGSSRLLLVDEWLRLFPGGCQFALPERSCAVVVSLGLASQEQQTVLGMVEGCYTGGTTPMLPGLYSPEQFVVEG